MMPNLSVKANLSKRYTNHCLRATVVTTLKDAGFSNHEVCASVQKLGRQNQASIENYNRLDWKGSKRPSDTAAVLDGKENIPTCVPAAKCLQLKSLQDRDGLSKINKGLFSLFASNCKFVATGKGMISDIFIDPMPFYSVASCAVFHTVAHISNKVTCS